MYNLDWTPLLVALFVVGIAVGGVIFKFVPWLWGFVLPAICN